MSKTNDKQITFKNTIPFKSAWLLLPLVFLLQGCIKDKDRLRTELSVTGPAPLVNKANLASGDHLDPYQTGLGLNKLAKRPNVSGVPQVELPRRRLEDDLSKPGSFVTGDVDFSFSNVPLPAFIQTVFGDYLQVDYQMDPAIAQKRDVVTLRTAQKRPPHQLYKLTLQILKKHGIQVIHRNGLYSIELDAALESKAPLIIRTRSAANVPSGMQPVFQIIDVNYVDKENVKEYITQAYGDSVEVDVAPEGNAIVLIGSASAVKPVVDSIHMFDQPAFANRKSVRLNLSFLTAEKLSSKLVDILKAEGYNVSDSVEDEVSSVTLLPIAPLNAVLVFAPNDATISHIMKWTKELDNPAISDPNGGLYYIPIRNTSAKELGTVMNDVLSRSGSSSPLTRRRSPLTRRGRTTPLRSAAASSSSGKVVVDEIRNAIVFRGTAEEYGQLVPLIQSMDVPVRDVLIEVTIAEINHTGDLELGVDWFGLKGKGIRRANILGDGVGKTPDTTTAAGASTSCLDLIGCNDPSGLLRRNTAQSFLTTPTQLSTGLNLSIMRTFSERFMLIHALQKSGKTTVLNNPRLMTRSGGEAKFNVGRRVSVIKSQEKNPSSGETAGTTNLIQNFEYIDTGALLKIKPTIHAGRRIELDVEQTISEAVSGNTSNPDIIKTELVTNLSLADGNTVLIGGFIRETKGNTSNGVPILRDIPLLGRLFRSDVETKANQEIILLITPYIIDTEDDADAITRAFRNKLGGWLKWDKNDPKCPDYKAPNAQGECPIPLTQASAPAA